MFGLINKIASQYIFDYSTKQGSGQQIGEIMQLHLFHFTPHGLARAYSHLVAGKRLCNATGIHFRPLIPDSVNSMTAAWNVYQTFQQSDLPRPKTIIDVGANVSQMTCLLLGTAPDAEVFSFEPNPKLAPAGKVYRIALSDTDGTADFFSPSERF